MSINDADDISIKNRFYNKFLIKNPSEYRDIY